MLYLVEFDKEDADLGDTAGWEEVFEGPKWSWQRVCRDVAPGKLVDYRFVAHVAAHGASIGARSMTFYEHEPARFARDGVWHPAVTRHVAAFECVACAAEAQHV